VARRFWFKRTGGGSAFKDGRAFKGTDSETVTPPPAATGFELTVLGTPLAVRFKSLKSDAHVSAQVKGLRFRSTIPGGFASCELQINRPLALDPDELGMFSDLIVYDGRHGGTVWQGRIEDLGRAAGSDGETWTVRAVGPSAHAQDRYAQLSYIDTTWREWRRFQGVTQTDGVEREQEDEGGSGVGALHLQFIRGSVVTNTYSVGREYKLLEELGLKLARVSYTWDAGKSTASYKIALDVGDFVAYPQVTSQSFATGGGSSSDVVVTDFTDGDDKCKIYIWDNGGSTIADDTTWASVTSMAVLSMLKDASGADITSGYTTDSYTANQIVNDLLGRLLSKYDGAGASVATNTYAITQLSYPDGVTAESVLNDLMIFEPEYYWAAWEESLTNTGKYQFEWKQWPETANVPDIRYEARAADGFDSPGSGHDIYNAVIVRWRDSIGRIRRTRRTATVAVLDDASLTREALIDLGDEIGSSANATQAGDQFLAEHAAAPNAGRLTVRRPIPDYTLGRMVQPWEIRPGGHIRVLDVQPRVDALNPTGRDGVTIFRVVGTEYDANSNTATLELDSAPRTLEGLLRRALSQPEKRRR
jgi:hypothetical protein